MKKSFILALLILLVSASVCTAGQVASKGGCLEIIKGGGQIYAQLQCDESVHVYWATYDIRYNWGSIKTSEGTHSTYFMEKSNRPPKHDSQGYLTTEYLRWLAQLNYTHLTESGEKIVFLTNSGLTGPRKEKGGKYYFYVWGSESEHARYVEWCRKNGINRND